MNHTAHCLTHLSLQCSVGSAKEILESIGVKGTDDIQTVEELRVIWNAHSGASWVAASIMVYEYGADPSNVVRLTWGQSNKMLADAKEEAQRAAQGAPASSSASQQTHLALAPTSPVQPSAAAQPAKNGLSLTARKTISKR
jgi:hypothetical protein